mgnify:CR=1 FL=1
MLKRRKKEEGWNWDGNLNPNPFTRSVGDIFHRRLPLNSTHI